MNAFHGRRLALALALGSLLLAACDVDVHEQGKDKNIDVRTVLGDISVRSTEGGPETGLPVYPGAQAMRDEDEELENADIKLGTSFFGLHLAAAKFESKDAPGPIVDFYKDKMSAHGTVIECRGDIDFDDDSKEPVCKEDAESAEIELVTGTADNHRMVAVKPRGDGSEFAVVSIQIDEKN